MDLFTFFLMLIEALQKCRDDRREPDIVESLMRPGRRVKRVVKVNIRSQTRGTWPKREQRRRERDRLYHEAMAKLAASSHEEIVELVTVAANGDESAHRALASRLAKSS